MKFYRKFLVHLYHLAQSNPFMITIAANFKSPKNWYSNDVTDVEGSKIDFLPSTLGIH